MLKVERLESQIIFKVLGANSQIFKKAKIQCNTIIRESLSTCVWCLRVMTSDIERDQCQETILNRMLHIMSMSK
jgi:hypothetical protein